MGSQPSSLSTNRELKGFIATKQLSARRKIYCPLSKRFSNSDLLPDIYHNNQNGCFHGFLKRSHSENIILTTEVTDLAQAGINYSKKVTSCQRLKSQQLFPSLLNIQEAQQRQTENQICKKSKKEIGKKRTSSKKNMEAINVSKPDEIGSFDHLDHWVQKNEPYIQPSDIHPAKIVPVTAKITAKDDVEEDEDDVDEESHIPDDQIEDPEKEKIGKIEKVKISLAQIKASHCERTPEGYFTDEFRKDIAIVYKATFKTSVKFKVQMVEEMLKPEHDTILIYCRLLIDLFPKGYRNSEGKPLTTLYRPLHYMIFLLLNTTDCSALACLKVMEQTKFVDLMIKKVHHLSKPHLNKELKVNDNSLLRGMMGILHNLSQHDENIVGLRQLNIIESMKPYLNSHSDMRRLSALATLAGVVNEEESEILQSHSSLIAFNIKCLKSAMKMTNRRKNGWTVREITRCLGKIARNDTNKRTVFTYGAVQLLVKLAENPKYVEEQREAVSALWTLSFDHQNQAEMINDPDCQVIDAFYKLCKSEDEKVRKICNKALWTMREQLQQSQRYKSIGEEFLKPTPSSKELSETDTHIMISYQWDHQGCAKDICSNIRNSGHKVWMDVDDMQGSTIQAMANAVERADIVLICFSQKYKNSDNCRAEAEYAYQLKKRIIPLKMEKGYKPDGWLGFIIGAKLFFDFGGKYPFETKVKDLLKEIQVQLNKDNISDIPRHKISSSVPSKPRPVSAVKPPKDLEKVKVWTREQVGRWLDKNNLPRNLLGRLSGIEVAFLHVLVYESPDMYYKTIGDQLGIKDILTMAKLRFALEVLDINI